MKDNYDFSKMRRVPHPLAGKVRLISNIGRLSDAEFESKLKDMDPDERIIAKRLRKQRNSGASSGLVKNKIPTTQQDAF